MFHSCALWVVMLRILLVARQSYYTPPGIPFGWSQSVSNCYSIHTDKVCSRSASCCLPPPSANAYCSRLVLTGSNLALATNLD